jgi:hypothetical protein
MRKVIINLMWLAAISLTLWYVLPFRLYWLFDRIERHAKKAISGAELQAWATNLLAHSSINTTPEVSELGTNFPRQLLRVFDEPPIIKIHEETTNSQANICLMWGGGIIGHCGFDIGATNFIGNRGNKWNDGVYFWSEHPQK